MTGSGNDFVMVDGRITTPEEWTAQGIQSVCARGTGIGADGLVFVLPGSQPQSARMIYFNSDGSHAAMCGNAALCSTWLAARLGIAPASGMRLETDAGTYESRSGADYCADLHLAPVAAPAAVPELRLGKDEKQAVLATVGVPHLVVLVDDVDQVDLPARGRALRFDPALGPAGANVNILSPTQSASEWRMRTYERGVEGETLACGTGSVAAACAIQEWGLGPLPLVILTPNGRRMDVRAQRLPDGRYDDVWLSGEARLVFRGVLA